MFKLIKKLFKKFKPTKWKYIYKFEKYIFEDETLIRSYKKYREHPEHGYIQKSMWTSQGTFWDHLSNDETNIVKNKIYNGIYSYSPEVVKVNEGWFKITVKINKQKFKHMSVCLHCIDNHTHFAIPYSDLGCLGDGFCDKHGGFAFSDSSLKILCTACAKEQKCCQICGGKITWEYKENGN